MRGFGGFRVLAGEVRSCVCSKAFLTLIFHISALSEFLTKVIRSSKQGYIIERAAEGISEFIEAMCCTAERAARCR